MKTGVKTFRKWYIKVTGAKTTKSGSGNLWQPHTGVGVGAHLNTQWSRHCGVGRVGLSSLILSINFFLLCSVSGRGLYRGETGLGTQAVLKTGLWIAVLCDFFVFLASIWRATMLSCTQLRQGPTGLCLAQTKRISS